MGHRESGGAKCSQLEPFVHTMCRIFTRRGYKHNIDLAAARVKLIAGSSTYPATVVSCMKYLSQFG